MLQETYLLVGSMVSAGHWWTSVTAR